MSYVIKVENLSKVYIIGHQKQDRYQTFRESLRHTARGLYQRMRHPLSLNREQVDMEEFWALKDVSFEVKQGDRIGIIGRNGAGKSTLLKILSRITEPTTGRINIRGRVASLLEVGTGFHPELTGRENIFLNGAILGMGRREIKNKFDEIIAFAEVEKFLDTPVKRYSSGMYVRLAFAVAAHLEPELLLVDEVLAVGDINFQKKCLGKMEDAANNGRTILFVSHNMGAIQSLCNKAVLLKKGSIKKEGGVQEVVQSYLNENDVLSCQKWSFEKQGSLIKNDFIEPQSLSLLDTEGQILPSHIERTRPVFVELVFNLKQLRRDLTLGIAVYNSKGDYLFHSLQTDGNEKLWPELEKGINRLRMKLPVDILNEGEYRLVLIGALHKTQWLYNPDQSDVMVNFTIAGGLSESPYWLHGRRGMFAPCLTWTKVKG